MYAIPDAEGKLISSCVGYEIGETCPTARKFIPSENIVIKDSPLCKDNASGLFKEICPTITSLNQEKYGNFLAQRWKDKWSHGWETEEGYTIVFTLQKWMYATSNVEGELVSSNNVVRKDSPPANVELHLRPIKPFFPQVTNPTFQNDMLMLPSVDLPEKGVAYQNVMLNLTKEGEWQLLDFLITQELQQIDKVEIIKTDSFPIQIFLIITGSFTSGCEEIGQISTRLLGKKFDIWIYSTQDKKFSTSEFACTEGFSSFTHIIPLPAYSLKKGEYKYSVNGHHTGTFNLDKNNKL